MDMLSDLLTCRQIMSPACAKASSAVSIAQTEVQISTIGRLRYELYIARDGKTYAHADQTQKSFIEPVDRRSFNFQVTEKNARVLTAIRLTHAADAYDDPHLKLLLDASNMKNISRTVVCSRFIARPELRARAMIVPLFWEIYQSCVSIGAKHCLVGTRNELIGLFERFGFTLTGQKICDPIASEIHILNLDINAHDLSYIQQANARFLSFAKKLTKHSTYEVSAEVV